MAAGTLVDLEELTCQIGDEFTRLLTEQELGASGKRIARDPPTARTAGGTACRTMNLSRPCSSACEASWPLCNPSIYSDRRRRAFFPLARGSAAAAKQRHDQSVTESGLSQQRQLSAGRRGVEELADIRVSPKQVRRLVVQVGDVRLAERDEAVKQLQAMPLPQASRRESRGSALELAVISMDGGRYQRRDHFRGQPALRAKQKHWRW